MNQLKAVFASTFILFSALGAIYSAVQAISLNYPAIWISPAVAIGTGAFFFSLIMLRHTPTTSKYLTLYLATNLIATGVTFILFMKGGDALAIIMAAISSIGWLAYVFWYSDISSRSKTQLSKGQQLENVAFTNVEGKETRLSEIGSGDKILLFYRGNWCPFCVAQVKDMAAQYDEIKALGADVAFISSQHEGHTKKLARSLKIGAHFLIDKDLTVAKSIGIYHQNGIPMGMEVLGYDSDTVMPTVAILNKDNIVIHSDLTAKYRVRPEPKQFLEILRNRRA